MLPLILFYIFATILVLAGLGVILSRNPVYSAVALVLCFFTSAVLWLLIEAEFLAIVLVLVYVGAVMVLFLFVIMMVDIDLDELRRGFVRYAWLGWVTTGVLLLETAGVVVSRRFGLDTAQGGVAQAADYSNTRELGTLLYSHYAYPFELAAMLLLVAIVAAIALTLRGRRGQKVQDVPRQVATRARDRMRLVQMKPEQRQ